MNIFLFTVCFIFQAVCLEEATSKIVQVVSPIHPDTTEAEFHNLRTGNYLVHLEIYVRITRCFTNFKLCDLNKLLFILVVLVACVSVRLSVCLSIISGMRFFCFLADF